MTIVDKLLFNLSVMIDSNETGVSYAIGIFLSLIVDIVALN